MSRLMTDGEIRTSYRQAKNPKKQIGILAQLNQCSKEEICRIIAGEPAEKSPGVEPQPVKQRKQRAKLDAEIKKKIAAEYLAGGITRDEIARLYGISPQTVSNIVQKYKKNNTTEKDPQEPIQENKEKEPPTLPCHQPTLPVSGQPPKESSCVQKSSEKDEAVETTTRTIDSLFNAVDALMAQTEREYADFENIAIIKSEYSTNCIVEKDGIRIDVQKLNTKEKKQ